MVASSTCDIFGTGTVKITKRDGNVNAPEAVRYVPEARNNLISIKVLDEEDARSKCNKASSQLVKKT